MLSTGTDRQTRYSVRENGQPELILSGAALLNTERGETKKTNVQGGGGPKRRRYLLDQLEETISTPQRRIV